MQKPSSLYTACVCVCVFVCVSVHACMHLLSGAVTAGLQYVKERHAGAIHHGRTGLPRNAGHFLIAFGRLSHYPLDLRVTNQRLTQSGGTDTHKLYC